MNFDQPSSHLLSELRVILHAGNAARRLRALWRSAQGSLCFSYDLKWYYIYMCTV